MEKENRKMTRFEQYLLARDNVSLEGMNDELIDLVLAYYRPYVIVGLYADINAVIYSNWLAFFEDQKIETLKKAYEGRSNFNKLKLDQQSRIAHDSALIDKLQSLGITIGYNELELMYPTRRSRSFPSPELFKLREELNKEGLDEYIEKVVIDLLGEDDYLYLGKTTERNLDEWDYKPVKLDIIPRPKVKRIIREYQRSAK